MTVNRDTQSRAKGLHCFPPLWQVGVAESSMRISRRIGLKDFPAWCFDSVDHKNPHSICSHGQDLQVRPTEFQTNR